MSLDVTEKRALFVVATQRPTAASVEPNHSSKEPAPMEPVTVDVVDVAAQAREMFGDAASAIAGRPLPANDYRFVAKTPTGGEVTFHSGATAAHVVAYLEQLDQERVAAGQPRA